MILRPMVRTERATCAATRVAVARDAPRRLVHRHDGVVRAVDVAAPPLAVVRKDHRVARRLDHREARRLAEVRGEGRVDRRGVLVVPRADLRRREVRVAGDERRVAQVVRLEEHVLAEARVRDVGQRVRECLAGTGKERRGARPLMMVKSKLVGRESGRAPNVEWNLVGRDTSRAGGFRAQRATKSATRRAQRDGQPSTPRRQLRPPNDDESGARALKTAPRFCSDLAERAARARWVAVRERRDARDGAVDREE